ncbi:MAG: hypothetical protein RL338_1812 [Chloroflexota bacterium]
MRPTDRRSALPPLAATLAALLLATVAISPVDGARKPRPTPTPTPAPTATPTPPGGDPTATSITWSGLTWTIKRSTSAVGPGPNIFSAANVWVDANGYLHLRISKDAKGRWTSAEIVGPNFGYGTYAFELGSRVDALDPNAVLGLFTWSDLPDYAYREIDIEFARWGWAGDPTNGQYVVQPWDAANHLERFTTPPTVPQTHRFAWREGRIDWSSDASGSPIASYAYAGADVPVPGGDVRPRLNLWLYGGKAPATGQSVEVVIRSFTWTP